MWHSLAGRHAFVAISSGSARRYPPSIAPFVGVSEATEAAAQDLASLVQPGERIGILSVIPPLPWEPIKCIDIHQFVWPNETSGTSDEEAVLLNESHLPMMLELTSLVYPAYFRSGTARLGDYVGIIRDGQLCAMAGIRMSMDGFQEISAICTHPDFRGRGLAGRLTRHLVHQIQEQGDVAFLHTESDNEARHIYHKLGFELRSILPFKIFEISPGSSQNQELDR